MANFKMYDRTYKALESNGIHLFAQSAAKRSDVVNRMLVDALEVKELRIENERLRDLIRTLDYPHESD